MKYDDQCSFDKSNERSTSEHINLFELLPNDQHANKHGKINNQVKRKYYLKNEFEKTSLILNNCSNRNNNRNEDDDDENAELFKDLVVIGYSSNLYRDDFNALKIEDKSNLIPWNRDQNLLIDRFDCRGYLHDLRPYDADLLTKEARNPSLNSEELEIEHMCDHERYMYLNKEIETNQG
jgi:hypothetical protein